MIPEIYILSRCVYNLNGMLLLLCMGFTAIYNSCNECNVYSYCVLFKWKAK